MQDKCPKCGAEFSYENRLGEIFFHTAIGSAIIVASNMRCTSLTADSIIF